MTKLKPYLPYALCFVAGAVLMAMVPYCTGITILP